MNRKQFNGGLIGNGAQDNRTFLTLTTTARALSSFLLIAYRYFTGEILGRATSIFGIAGTVRLSGTTTGRATSTLDLTVQSDNTFDAIGTYGFADSATSLTAQIPLLGTIHCSAQAATALGGVLQITGSTVARATSVVQLLATGFLAPDERTMSIPYEDRTMVVH